MEALIEELKTEYPNSIASHRIFLNAAGTAELAGHRGVGTAITFKGDEAIVPRVLMPHRLFSHTLGVRLDVPPEKAHQIRDSVRAKLADALPHETLDPDKQTDHVGLQQLVDDFGEESGNDSAYTQYLPFEAWVSLMVANETAEDEAHFYLVIKTHSGLAGRQFVRKLWPTLDTRVTVHAIRSSVEYRALDAYTEFMSRGLLMSYLNALGLDMYVADLPSVSSRVKRGTNIRTRDPHFDMITNHFDGLTLLNECYDVKACVGKELFFLSDTLHNGILMTKPRIEKKQDLFLPAHGNFFESGTEIQLTEKHKRRMHNGEWTFCDNFPFAIPEMHTSHYKTSHAAVGALRRTIGDDVVFDSRRGIAPVYQVCN